ncbi:MAG: PQQ-dependent sugar dehydrogenase [Verrucomicrobia bacterium]|nr:PQQ-dependent sugar dehydrogenase [Verrucomicrobiota bacterium]
MKPATVLRFALIAFTAWLAEPHARAAVALQPLAEGFVSPLNFASLPGGSGDFLVGDQVGVIHVVTKAGERRAEPFLDLKARLTTLRSNFDERGLLGLALHPKFKANGKLYVYYSAPLCAGGPKDWDHTSHIAEYRVPPGARAADPASERVLLQIDEPQFNHNSGRLAFGPDGFLYISVGDGGGQRDSDPNHGPIGNGQNKDVLLGKILRLDVDRRHSGREYAIPKDNPFAHGGGRAEIFSYGHRNPWGLSFDRGGKHELIEAEVGENMWEEVNLVKRGGNHGWRLREGPVGFDPANPLRPPEVTPRHAPDGTPFVEPIITYMNAKGFPGVEGIKGTSITGGYIYRGKALPELKGRYVFADWSKSWGVPVGMMLVATRPKSGDGAWTLERLDVQGSQRGEVQGFIPAMGEDEHGELYVLTSGRNIVTGTTGKVWKLVPAKLAVGTRFTASPFSPETLAALAPASPVSRDGVKSVPTIRLTASAAP